MLGFFVTESEFVRFGKSVKSIISLKHQSKNLERCGRIFVCDNSNNVITYLVDFYIRRPLYLKS